MKRVADMVNNLLRSVLMNDTEVFRSFSLLDELKLLRDRLFVANIELGHKLDDPAVRSKPCAVLSILRQPFPCVFTKGCAVFSFPPPFFLFLKSMKRQSCGGR